MKLIHKDLGRLKDSNFTYCLAGGAIRSWLLSLEIKDYDYYLKIPSQFVKDEAVLELYVSLFCSLMGWNPPVKASLDFEENDYNVSKGLVKVYNTNGVDGEAIQVMAMKSGHPLAWVDDFDISTGEFLQHPDGRVYMSNWAKDFLERGIVRYTQKHVNKPKYLERMKTYFLNAKFVFVDEDSLECDEKFFIPHGEVFIK